MCLCTVCWRLRGTPVPDLRQNHPSPDHLLFVTREDRSRLAHRDLGCRWLGNGGFDAIKVCRRCWTWLTEENRRRVEAIQRDGGGQAWATGRAKRAERSQGPVSIVVIHWVVCGCKCVFFSVWHKTAWHDFDDLMFVLLVWWMDGWMDG